VWTRGTHAFHGGIFCTTSELCHFSCSPYFTQKCYFRLQLFPSFVQLCSFSPHPMSSVSPTLPPFHHFHLLQSTMKVWVRGTATDLKWSLPNSTCSKTQNICGTYRTHSSVILRIDTETFCRLTHYLNNKLPELNITWIILMRID
jgi:hypothetical protein